MVRFLFLDLTRELRCCKISQMILSKLVIFQYNIIMFSETIKFNSSLYIYTYINLTRRVFRSLIVGIIFKIII